MPPTGSSAMSACGVRATATPNHRVHMHITSEETTQTRLPTAISSHIPRIQPMNEAIQAATAIHEAHAGIALGVRVSLPAITATANARKMNPVVFPSLNAHHASNIAVFPETAALATTVGSATAVVKVQRAPTGNTAQAVVVQKPWVRRDVAASTTKPATAKKDRAAAAAQWTTTHRLAPSAMIFICVSDCVAGGPCKASDAASRSDATASQIPATRRLTCECDIDQPPSGNMLASLHQVEADSRSGFPRIRGPRRDHRTRTFLRAVNRGVSALRHWIEPKRESPREAMLTLRLKWMKLSSVNVAQQPLEFHAPEQPSTAHRLERLFD